MYSKKEIEKIMEWCEKTKKERNSIYIIERNPFSSEIDWARNIISIEIDRPLSMASKTSLVYDSTSKKLYKFVNGVWAPISLLTQ
ncbi:MAG: hypothetical protein PHS02_01495 [Candidatus ainarchaeum sp.]|nr:hypothetical protein [Candidatus ainarchaeum sp.]